MLRCCRLAVAPLLRSLTCHPSLAASSCSITEDGRKLRLLCDDEPERRYHGVWLRHNCRCPVCLSPATKQNIVHHENLMDLKIINATIKGDDVNVKWNSRAGTHSCAFNTNWLRDHDYTTPGIHEQRLQDSTPPIAKSLPTCDYNDAVSSSEGYYEWMKQINYYGMLLVQNVPVRKGELVKLTDKICPPQEHGYTKVFEVFALEKDISDAAYTTDDLLLHSDQNFYEASPGLQILFCLKFDDCVEGGYNSLVDMYPVVKDFKEKYPKQFEVLTRVPYITHRKHDDIEGLGLSVSFKYSIPHISVDYSGEICSMSWSPQFHYPLSASEKDTEEYYEAFTLLSSMFEESPLKVFHRLRPGEAIIVNNRRVLHARSSFKLNGGERSLQGHYINADFFLSKLRTLSRQLKKDEPIKRMFNRSHI